MVKYKEYFKKMCEEHKDDFNAFLRVHQQYQSNKKVHQNAFNEQGKAIRRIIEEWDKRLCNTMEKGNNATYSARLSEKFWGEVRTLFPLIDFVGAKIN
jgi:hypothetical protein